MGTESHGDKSPWQGIGWLGVAAAFVNLSYYSVVAGWTLHYSWLALGQGFEGLDGPAVKALFGCCSSCTAFKVSDSGQFLTNNHCTSSQSGVQSTELRFEYQLSGCGAGTSGYTGSVLGSQLLATGATLDYTLMATNGDSSSIPCVILANRLAQPGEIMYIAGHPAGGVKKLSIDSDLDGGRCGVGTSPCAGAALASRCARCPTKISTPAGAPRCHGSLLTW